MLEYLTADGKCPFADWLKALQDMKARAIIRVRLNRLRLGNFGDCKSTGKGVSELKIDFGPGYRVYFGQKGDSRVIQICGGGKKEQKRDTALSGKNEWVSDASREANTGFAQGDFTLLGNMNVWAHNTGNVSWCCDGLICWNRKK